jgi:hypothetical protein
VPRLGFRAYSVFSSVTSHRQGFQVQATMLEKGHVSK